MVLRKAKFEIFPLREICVKLWQPVNDNEYLTFSRPVYNLERYIY